MYRSEQNRIIQKFSTAQVCKDNIVGFLPWSVFIWLVLVPGLGGYGPRILHLWRQKSGFLEIWVKKFEIEFFQITTISRLFNFVHSGVTALNKLAIRDVTK